MINLFVGFIFSGIIAAIAYKKKSLSLSGAAAAVFLGSFMFYFGGWVASALMVSFFVSSSVLTLLFNGKKKKTEKLHEKGGRRDALQVFANGGIGLLFAALFHYSRNPLFLLCCAVSFGESNGDTWASEIGVLSKKAPISILTGKRIERGVSGGISPLGTLAALAGSTFMAGVFFCMYFLVYGYNKIMPLGLIIISILGFLGTLIDSILGASIQAQYFCQEENLITEKKDYGGKSNKLIKGFRFFNNDMINFLSNALSSSVVFLLLGR